MKARILLPAIIEMGGLMLDNGVDNDTFMALSITGNYVGTPDHTDRVIVALTRPQFDAMARLIARSDALTDGSAPDGVVAIDIEERRE